jgi:Icc-related predicted phosphoesterase
MGFVFLSDTHSRHRDFSDFMSSLKEEPELVIHTGDFSRGWNPEPTDVLDFIGWVRAYTQAPILIVPGNHDVCLDPNKNNKAPELIEALKEQKVFVLVGETYYHKGLSFIGVPWTPIYGRCQAYMDSDERLEALYQCILPEHDVILSHGPPYGFLDRVYDFRDAEYKPFRVGSKKLWKRLDFIRKELPKNRYVFYGHIHEDKGRRTIKNYELYNISQEIHWIDHIGLVDNETHSN